MIRASNALALLKVLAAVAWADRTFSQSEMNYIKELARRFDLDDEEWFALQPYLEDPPDENEREAVLRDLLSKVASDTERKAIVGHIEAVISADDRITSEESELLRRYKEILSEPSSLDLMLGRLKGLFQDQPRHSQVDLDEFLRNKIIFKLRRRHTEVLEVTPEMHRLALLGGLMGIVAHADHEIHEREMEEIRHQLNARGHFDDMGMDLLLAVIHEESVRGLDRYRLIGEYTRDATLDDRVELLDLLFSVAAADGGLTHLELEELRAMSSAMHLGHTQYINAKLRINANAKNSA